MIEEIWKDIPRYKGYYQASNLGRIRSLDRIVYRKRNGNETQGYNRTGRILIPTIEGSNYWQVLISINGLVKRAEKVHRLVAFAFLENSENKKCVNHKDGNKSNNTLDNLEWMTHSENLRHAHKTGLKTPTQLGKSGYKHHLSHEVITINETAIFEHGSIRECAKFLKCDPATVINIFNSGKEFKGHRIFI